MLLTFTNKAARQMLDRVANLLPVDASGLWGGTFHSIGNRMLRRHGSALGYSSGFTIMDREDQKDLIDTVVAAAGIDPKEIRFPKGDVLADIFSFAVNTERPMEELLAEKFPYFLPLLEQIKDVHARYERKKKSTNSMDFDDLLEKTLRMLKEHEEIAAFYRRQVSVHPRGRISGHEQDPGRLHRHARGRASQRDGGGRRRAVDLLVARREFQKHPRLSRSAIRTRRSSRSR